MGQANVNEILGVRQSDWSHIYIIYHDDILGWPDAKEYVTIRKNSDIYVVHQDRVEVASLFIAKECVRLPDLLRISEGEVFQPT